MTIKTPPSSAPRATSTKIAPAAPVVDAKKTEQVKAATDQAAAFDNTPGSASTPTTAIAAGGMTDLRNNRLSDAALFSLILPQSATKADLSGATTIKERLQRASLEELHTLLSDRHVALQAEAEQQGMPRLSLGPQFVHLGRTVPGQTRISMERAIEKVELQVKYDGFDDDNAVPTPAFDNGNATVPIEIHKPAIAGPNGMVLMLDGNHQNTGAILACAKSVPVDIVADMQDVDEETFWQTAEANGWLYLRNKGGEPAPVIRPSYATLEQDSVRYDMSQLALKAKLKDGSVLIEDDSRLSTRIWAKLKGKTVDFIEFRLADLVYDAAENDADIAKAMNGTLAEKAEAYRQVLTQAKSDGRLDTDLLGIRLLDGETPIDELTTTIADALN